MRDGSLSSYTISPFIGVGWLAVAWGNLGLGVVGGFGINAIVAAIGASAQRIGRRSTASSSSSASVLATTFSIDVQDANPAAFPALGLTALTLWVPGSVLGATALLIAEDSTTAERAAGCIALTCSMCTLAAWQVVLVRRVLPHAIFTPRSHQTLHDGNVRTIPAVWVPSWLRPVGSWSPPSLRNRFSLMFTAHAAVWAAKLRIVFHFGLSCAAALLTAISFISIEACQISCVVLGVLHVAGAVVFILGSGYFRHPFECPIAAILFLLLGVQCWMLAASAPVPASIPVVQVALTLLRTTLKIVSRCVDDSQESTFGDNSSERNEYYSSSSTNASFLKDALVGSSNNGSHGAGGGGGGIYDVDGFDDDVDMSPSFAGPPPMTLRDDDGGGGGGNDDNREMIGGSSSSIMDEGALFEDAIPSDVVVVRVAGGEEQEWTCNQQQPLPRRHFYSLSQHESLDQLQPQSQLDDGDRIHQAMLEKAAADQLLCEDGAPEIAGDISQGEWWRGTSH
jgi:hypothetical protein